MDVDKIKYDQSKKSEIPGLTAFRVSDDFIEQLIEEYEARGSAAVEEILIEYVKELVQKKCSHAIIEALLFIMDSPSPRYGADVLAVASGLRLRDGWTPATLAKKYGISRTTACTDVERACDHFGLCKEIALRGRMSNNTLCNQRNHVRKL